VSSAQTTSRVRFWIIAVIFVLTTINYASRATLSIAGAPLAHELHISAVRMGYLFSAFGWAYVIAQIPGGALLDRFGSKRVYLWSIILWSVFTASQALIGFSALPVVTGLFLARFLLGLAEAPSFPGNARIVANWFPNSERGTASAIFNSAQYFSIVVFGPLMGWLTQGFGWRYVFLAMGGLGLAAAAAFAAIVDTPTRHKHISKAEFDYIERGGALVHLDRPQASAPAKASVRWATLRQLLTNRMLLGIYLGQYCITALTYFYTTWFPIYLVQARGLSIMQAGFASAGPALCGWAGGILGGIVSDLLLKRGTSLTRARKLPIVIGLVISGAILLCNFTDSQALVLTFMSIAFFGKGIASLGWAVLSDVAPREVTGLSGSIFNTFGNVSGIVTPVIIGYIVAASGSFDLALLFVFTHSVVALLSFVAIVGPIRRLVLQPAAESAVATG